MRYCVYATKYLYPSMRPELDRPAIGHNDRAHAIATLPCTIERSADVNDRYVVCIFWILKERHVENSKHAGPRRNLHDGIDQLRRYAYGHFLYTSFLLTKA